MKHPRRAASPTARKLAAITAIVAVTAVGCSSPTAPGAEPLVAVSQLQLSDALVVFGGRSVNGQTIQVGHMQSTSTRFQARLTNASGPALERTVQVQYQRPGGGPGMMGGGPGQGPGYMYLYDDGTHGDPTPGDGIYCLEDTTGQYGFHHQGAPHGQYHYEFFGIDHDDHHSNHMQVVVTVVS